MRRMGIMAALGLAGTFALPWTLALEAQPLTTNAPGIVEKAVLLTNRPVVTASNAAPPGYRTNAPGVKWLEGWKSNGRLVGSNEVWVASQTNGTVAVTLAWDAEVNVDSYNLYWGPATRTYTNSVSTATNSVTISNLTGRVFFAATSMHYSLESDYSAEVSWPY